MNNNTAISISVTPEDSGALEDSNQPALSRYKVRRRDGSVVPFEANKIAVAMTKAFLAAEGSDGTTTSSRVKDIVSKITEQIVDNLIRRQPEGLPIHIEHIQDQVELALMRAGEHEVARGYVLYREKRTQERSKQQKEFGAEGTPVIHTQRADGTRIPLNYDRLRTIIEEACQGLGDAVAPESIFEATIKNLYDGVAEEDVFKSAILSARTLIEKDPAYSYVTARLLLDQIRKEVMREALSHADMSKRYADCFAEYIRTGIEAGRIDSRLAQFDLDALGKALKPDRDLQFQYLGLQTLYDRYLLHIDGRRFELPQIFWMRVAMGLSLNEIHREERAISFYEVLSSFDFTSATPTLFNSGTCKSQLSSCFLTTVSDDLIDIYDGIKENALLSKFSGGLGNDWTAVRALGAHIEGTNGKSQGVVPFLKVVNDTAVAVNQGGKRKGAVCSYLETWHLDIEEFLELRKNTGDDRRRTHDMNTANWVPDLFMERVINNAEWTLFSPDEVPELHDSYGSKFKELYERYERLADEGKIKLFKRIPALQLWRKMLTMLFETGHPWVTFKDPCNLRSPQQHKGVVHSSNLCTEITLNTSSKEIAVCNLGSINLVNHITENGLDIEKLQRTCRTAMRMLDNVIEINYYSVGKARYSNLQHRPVGLGMMGFQDALLKLRIPYASQEAMEFADKSMEAVSYYAILASSELSAERGPYASYPGSLWDQGILPIDSIELLRQARGGGSNYLDMDSTCAMDWTPVREHIAKHGMRSSNCLAIAPTATISNIIGVSQSIEPIFQNLFVKSNLSGDFTVLNPYLVEDLKKLGLWDEVMVHDLKYFDGSVTPIERIPEDLKALYATAFEVEPKWLIEAASRRQKWIDQGQSLNLYMAEPSGKKIDEMYKFAWTKGLKTTYYLRTLSATNAEKSTIQTNVLNAVKTIVPISEAKACLIEDPECEACQ
jgi:ribonucleoside-diphosphate reductase alpha chain